MKEKDKVCASEIVRQFYKARNTHVGQVLTAEYKNI